MPDLTLIPKSKYREAYLQLLSSDKKAFNKKIALKQFYESLNILGMHTH